MDDETKNGIITEQAIAAVEAMQQVAMKHFSDVCPDMVECSMNAALRVLHSFVATEADALPPEDRGKFGIGVLEHVAEMVANATGGDVTVMTGHGPIDIDVDEGNHPGSEGVN